MGNKNLKNKLPHASLAPAFPVLRLPSSPIKFQIKRQVFRRRTPSCVCWNLEFEVTKYMICNFFYLPCPNHLLQHEPQKLVQ